MFGSVLLVALFAALVSYAHIRVLGIRNGYDTYTASLLPIGVDGLIVGCGLMLASAARARLRASVARCGLWIGILATLSANAAYGASHGAVGMVVSAWPAAAFIVIVEAYMQLGKRKRKSKPDKPTAKKTRNQPLRPEAKETSKDFVPVTLPAPNGKGPVTAYKIRKELGCNQAKAAELAEIMNNDHVDLATAIKIRGGSPAVKVPGIKSIRTALHVGQSVAYEIQDLMRKHNVDMYKAQIMREEAKSDASTRN